VALKALRGDGVANAKVYQGYSTSPICRETRSGLSTKSEIKVLQHLFETGGSTCIALGNSRNCFGECLPQTRWLGAEEAAHLHNQLDGASTSRQVSELCVDTGCGCVKKGRVKTTIFLPKESIEPDLVYKITEALQRYCQFKIRQNEVAMAVFRREALTALLVSCFW